MINLDNPNRITKQNPTAESGTKSHCTHILVCDKHCNNATRLTISKVWYENCHLDQYKRIRLNLKRVISMPMYQSLTELTEA